MLSSSAGLLAGRHVADELHVAAEREPGDFPARALLIGPAEQLAAEADREHLGRNLEQTRDEIMAELVKEHERPQRADEGDQGQPERRLRKHQWQTAFIAE